MLKGWNLEAVAFRASSFMLVIRHLGETLNVVLHLTGQLTHSVVDKSIYSLSMRYGYEVPGTAHQLVRRRQPGGKHAIIRSVDLINRHATNLWRRPPIQHGADRPA